MIVPGSAGYRINASASRRIRICKGGLFGFPNGDPGMKGFGYSARGGPAGSDSFGETVIRTVDIPCDSIAR